MDTAQYIPLLSLITSAGVLDQKKLREDTDRIAAFYYDHGYLNVHVGEPQIVRIPKGLKVIIPIDEGPIYKIGAIDVSGDLKFPRMELTPLITIKPGEDFRGSAMQHDVLTLSDFYSDRGFAFVDVQPKTQLDPIARKVNITFAINPGARCWSTASTSAATPRPRTRLFAAKCRCRSRSPIRPRRFAIRNGASTSSASSARRASPPRPPRSRTRSTSMST